LPFIGAIVDPSQKPVPVNILCGAAQRTDNSGYINF
jgi:hypothetical protein